MDTPETPLTRAEVSAAVDGRGWRYILGLIRTSVPVRSLAEGVDVAARAVAAAGADADTRLRLDLRADRVVLSLQSPVAATVTAVEIDLAHRILDALDRPAGPDIGPPAPRSAQVLEIAIDALDPAAIRPFWKAVLGYVDEPGHQGTADPLVDPVGQGPAVWFQQMDAPRPQRNRIHLDISVPHDEAPHRLAAAVAAGGELRSDAEAPAFWVLADAEGNEACVTTWQGRD